MADAPSHCAAVVGAVVAAMSQSGSLEIGELAARAVGLLTGLVVVFFSFGFGTNSAVIL